jgi:putative transposase
LTHDFSVGLLLRVLGIPAATYYDWRTARRAPSRRAIEDAELLRLIDAIRGEHEFAATYGSPRVWLELRRRGVRVGRKRVERIMRVNGRKGAYLRKGWKQGSTRQNPKHTAAPDLLGRDFTAARPNQKWVADITRILTLEGVLWLASVRDAFSNKVVGWDSGPRATTELVISALDYAIWSRNIRDGELIHHSDKGCQVRFKGSSQHCLFGLRVGDVRCHPIAHSTVSLRRSCPFLVPCRALSSSRRESRWSPRSAARSTDLDARRVTTRIGNEEWPSRSCTASISTHFRCRPTGNR